LISEERPKEALEVLQRAHSPGVSFDYWSPYCAALLKYQEQLGAKNATPELLADALNALETTYKLCTGEGFKKDKIQILLNIGYVHRLRGDLDGEWRALQAAHEVDPQDQQVRVRMANVATDRGRLEEAIPMLEALLTDGPEYTPILLGVALAKRNSGAGADLQRAAGLFEQTAKMVGAVQPELRVEGVEALIKALRKMKQWDRAFAACAEFAVVLGSFRCRELEASIHLARGDTESAHNVLVEMAAGVSDMKEEQRRTLGTLLEDVGDNERAFGVLEPVAPRNEWNNSTVALIKAAQATGRDEFTIRICRQLRASGIVRNSVIDAEAAALARRGEMAAAIGIVERALADQEDPFLRLRLSTLGFASQRPDLLEKDPARLPKPGDGDPHVAVVAVGVLRAAGVHEEAIRYAYEAYRANRSSAEGWQAIIEAFMPTLGPTNHVDPDVVAVDTAVLIEEGKDRRWIVIEATDPEAEHGELSPSHPLVVAMLGKKVGELVELPRSPLPSRIYRVEEIRSKYVRAYHRCLEQWEELFPGVPGPLAIDIPENLEENIEEFTKQLMPMLQQRARRVEELDQLYRDNPVTFHLLASGLGGSVFGAMGHLIAETDLELRCTRASPAEMRELLSVLERGEKVILEASALSTLLLLQESDLFSTSLRGRVAISQSTLDELRSHLREVETRASGYMSCRDGRMTMGEIDEADRAEYRDLISELLAKASECEVFQEGEHDRLTHSEWDRLVRIGGAGAVESLHRAMRTGEPVWCDDMVLAFVAHERGIGVVWTQLICHHLLVRSALSAEHAQRISAKLVGWRFVSTSTTTGMYLEAARLAAWNPEHWPLRQHLRFFEVESWDERSTVTLAVNVLREWWRHALSDATANAVTIALLERIAARTNGPLLLDAIDRVLERAFGVDVLGYQRARAALDAWTCARPLRRGA
jgi:tetratricopeptide (TPR) repeat protein